MTTRREFVAGMSGLAFAASVPAVVEARPKPNLAKLGDAGEERVLLDGLWQFQLDPDSNGESKNLGESSSWEPNEVRVPHTWQIGPRSTEYFGTAWYRRRFDALPAWENKVVRIEFEAVFHSATVWINGQKAGEHLRKGYTAFTFDITSLLHFGKPNFVVVRVNNAFDNAMLPRGHSSDWTHDGGIYRSVSLLITPKVFVERVDVDAHPDLQAGTAEVEVSAVICNKTNDAWNGQISYGAVDRETGLTSAENVVSSPVSVKAGTTATIPFPKLTIRDAKLWHFDHPNLYALSVAVSAPESTSHQFSTTFGIRSIEVKDGAFHLNGEKVRLMGVERMAGSNPEFGMAEPLSWINHDHRDLKELNCVFTRVHWPQDKRILDFCDEHGIFIQTEVPTWGPDTFKDMKEQPFPNIMENGLEQLREMIARDRNHPSIFSWGLCNEIGGQNPPAFNFARRMYQEAKKLNPSRLCSYASNSLQSTPKQDVSSVMDFIEWNEYYESWYGGSPETLKRNLSEIASAYPGKPIVISEYGYCACTEDRPEGDHRRIEILRDHDQVFRESDAIGGLIFFCYNDYRTHIGDRGTGVMKQRVHGVVDLYGRRKPSYEQLRKESSPVEAIEVSGHPGSFVVTIQTRKRVPGYALRGYTLRGVLYGQGEIPLERAEVQLPTLTPGQTATVTIKFGRTEPLWVEFDVMRPNAFSAYSHTWKA